MGRDQIIQKIKKLKRLELNAKEIDSLGEAEAAAKRIQHLLITYNLEMQDIENTPEKDKISIDTQFIDLSDRYIKTEGSWISKLSHYIAVNHLCEVVVSGDNKGYFIIGSPENREVVVFMVDQLVIKFRQLESISWSSYKNNGVLKRNKHRRDFLKGACLGLYFKLCEQTKEMGDLNDQMVGLIHVNKDKLEKAKKDKFGSKLRKSRRTKVDQNMAFQDGYDKGKNTDVNKGISGSGGSTKFIE